MAYVYSGDIYRGGAAGVQSDLALREYYAQQQAQALSQGQGYATQEQIERAKRELDPMTGAYSYLAQNGAYSDADQQALVSARVGEVNAATKAIQQDLNAAMASRGQSANAGSRAALGMAGDFQAAGQRGKAVADVMAANKATQLTGLAGMADTAGAQAALSVQPTRIDTSQNDYMGMYDQWRNAQVGYDNAQWGTAPDQPAHYDYGTDVAGIGGGNVAGTGDMFNPKKGKKNKWQNSGVRL